MIYLEDEDNVRPSWMPHMNDYRQLDLNELQTVEDCQEALAWLRERLSELHAIRNGSDDAGYKFYNRQIAKCHIKKDKVFELSRQYWREERSEIHEQLHQDKLDRLELKHQLQLQHEAEVRARKEIEHEAKMERIKLANEENRLYNDAFRKLAKERMSPQDFEDCVRAGIVASGHTPNH